MKTLEIDETETQFVIKVAGSKVAHLAMKDDPENVRQTLIDVLAEAPELKPEAEEADPEPSSDGVDDDIGLEEAVETVLGAAKELFASPKMQEAKKLLERLPKSKRRKKSG